jgi:hypothetical protein
MAVTKRIQRENRSAWSVKISGYRPSVKASQHPKRSRMQPGGVTCPGLGPSAVAMITATSCTLRLAAVRCMISDLKCISVRGTRGAGRSRVEVQVKRRDPRNARKCRQARPVRPEAADVSLAPPSTTTAPKVLRNYALRARARARLGAIGSRMVRDFMFAQWSETYHALELSSLNIFTPAYVGG